MEFKKDFLVLALLALSIPLLFGCVAEIKPVAAPATLATVGPSSPVLSPVASFSAGASTSASVEPSLESSPQASSVSSVSCNPDYPSWIRVNVTIDNGTVNYSGGEYCIPPGSSNVLILFYLSSNSALWVETKNYSFGTLVTGIGGLQQNASANRYWQYYVDGVLAPVGADAYNLTKSCSIVWRYEQPPDFK